MTSITFKKKRNPSECPSIHSYGVVNWFGGYNSKYDRENNYGFVFDHNGTDVFLHKKEWNESDIPEEGCLVEYELINSNGKSSALKAKLVNVETLSSGEVELAVEFVESRLKVDSKATRQYKVLINELGNRILCSNRVELINTFGSKEKMVKL